MAKRKGGSGGKKVEPDLQEFEQEDEYLLAPPVEDLQARLSEEEGEPIVAEEPEPAEPQAEPEGEKPEGEELAAPADVGSLQAELEKVRQEHERTVRERDGILKDKQAVLQRAQQAESALAYQQQAWQQQPQPTFVQPTQQPQDGLPADDDVVTGAQLKQIMQREVGRLGQRVAQREGYVANQQFLVQHPELYGDFLQYTLPAVQARADAAQVIGELSRRPAPELHFVTGLYKEIAGLRQQLAATGQGEPNPSQQPPAQTASASVQMKAAVPLMPPTAQRVTGKKPTLAEVREKAKAHARGELPSDELMEFAS